LTFRNSEQLPDNVADRKVIFDIACTGEHGESFTVEMQKAKQLWFKDRALFCCAFPIQRQAQRGDWNFKLNPVFLVAILDFEYDERDERRKLYRLATLRDQDGDLFSDTLQMIFLQMPLFQLKESELLTQKDKWLYFLKNLESFDNIPAILREPIFEKAFDTAEYIRYSPELQEAYQNNLNVYRDNRNAFETAIIEGEARGEAKGRAEGEAKGRAEGLAEGEAKGKKNGILRTLTKRFNTVPAAMAADVNALTDVAEIEKLADLAFDCKTLDEFGKAMK
jgi:predicted transposase/invertase (TIGR01784 family)